MASKLFALIAIISISTTAAAQNGKEPLTLKPTSAWHVDYADDRCRLARQFGEGEEQVVALLDRYGPDDFFRMTLAGKPVKTSLENAEATVQFGPTEGEQQLFFLNGNVGKMPALVFASGVRLAPPSPEEQLAVKQLDKGEWLIFAPVDTARQAAIRYLSVGKPLRRAVILETGSMRAPFAALDKCIDDLLTHWGIDVEKHKTLTAQTKPVENPAKWVISKDYPVRMLLAGQPAIIEFRLSVGSDGVPTACHIQMTTRPKDFDAAVCGSLMKRARFTPAIDADGKPLASYYRNSVRFALP